ncbi:MAG: AI-2E family transporter [Candidatus Komeilibacteria bacterium]|nr:AI-2E family transporter [Candidatus Komeilibacteria bacterium]
MNQKNLTINISTETFFRLLIILAVLIFLFLIKEIVVVILVALILAAGFDPWVDWLQRHKIPRTVGILFIYLILFSFVALALILIVPLISNEVSQLSENFPLYYEKISGAIQNFNGPGNFTAEGQLQTGLANLSQNLPGTISNVFSTLIDIFGGIFSFFLVLVITFYLTVHEEGMKNFIKSLTPVKGQPYLTHLYSRIQLKMGQWLRGQIVLSLVIFILDFIGLTILNMPYALILAFLAALLEVVPFIGPWMAGFIAVFFGFMQSTWLGIAVGILFWVVQLLENNLIVPKVMSKAVGLNPLVVILVILIGAKLYGVVGALLAVPVATGIFVFLQDFIDKKTEAAGKLAE